MPIYEYHCDECGEDSELLVNGGTQPDCPKCGGKKLSKLLSIVAAPSREGAARGEEARPMGGGSCGAGCGCHPHG